MPGPAFSMTRNSTGQSQSRIGSAAFARPIWYEAEGGCVLGDSERHLGHAIQDGEEWWAYDAVHPNASRSGFLCLGRFKTMADAKYAIESSVGAFERWWSMEVKQARVF
jgi:hypothetical protein